tara:strand:- start:53 stop:1837 length:1785 start_codon:yes stop_codon:yes gene_type:complete
MNKVRILKITTPLAEVKKLAEKMSLTLLSSSMTNVHENLDWKCRNGHKFAERFYEVKRVFNYQKDNIRVCKKCSDQLDFIEIKNRGLKHKHQLILQDKSFISMSHTYKWKCKEGDINSFKISNHPNRGGCPDCMDQNKFNSITKIEKWLKTYEPEISICEGEVYKGYNGKIKILRNICKGTTLKRPNQIKARSLCKYCKGYQYELTVLQYMEQLFEGEWLYNTYPKNLDNMQLDGYCEKLKLAFEHHGSQHYRLVKNRTINKKALKESKERDKRKEKLCNENGIKLIVIKELKTFTPEDDLKQEIKDQCNGIKTKYFGGFNDDTALKKYRLPPNFDQIIPIIKNLHTNQLKKEWPQVIKLAIKLGFKVEDPEKIKTVIRLTCDDCSKTTSRSIYVLLKKEEGCTCQGKGLGIDVSDDEVMKKWYTDVAKKHNAEFLSIKKNKNGQKELKFKCKTCEKNAKLIQLIHSEFNIIDYNLRNNRFEKPITEMRLKPGKTFHPDCGAFGITKLTLKDVKNYIKRFELTAEILTTEKEFTSTTMSKYQFKCSNKRHEPHVFPKNGKYLREIKQMGENQSFGCKRCGQLNSNRPIDSYRKK